ncbi:peptidase S8/S53 domain-containing protein [Dimargaris cristalligena]|uniref:Peptidase S8/S53 domain-containing protein n=1 Tax=Dimargaris cristalligena TaxID=215637 RepID=A0A4Q0A0E4_9FUNG|nr:peptidase S8/S53 domain-containing protein [Dimargaris cristalligena]|eukprot:RKP39467.1 peptidase S8/S53 domain-containing protein [Dimargaris cristalligena]
MRAPHLFTLLALVWAAVSPQLTVAQLINPPTDLLNSGQVKIITNSYILQFTKETTSTVDFIKSIAKLGTAYSIQTDYLTVFNGVVLSMNEATAHEVAEFSMVDSVWPNLHLYPADYRPSNFNPYTNSELPDSSEPSQELKKRQFTSGSTSLPSSPLPTNPPLPLLYHQQVGVDQAHAKLKLRDKGVKIGIIDSGLDFNHPAFGQCFKTPGCRVAYGMDLVGPNFTPENYLIQPGSKPHDDCNGHGTHVAGIIAGNDGVFQGVAPEATLGVYKISSCASQGRSSSAIILMALQQAYKDGMEVINISYSIAGMWQESAEAVMASRLVAKNIVVVAAAGNLGNDNLWALSSPAAGLGVISVASITPEEYHAEYITVSNNRTRRIPRTASHTATRPFVFTDTPLELGTDSTGSTHWGCQPFNRRYNGSVLVLNLGPCDTSVQATNALKAGAVGLISVNIFDLLDVFMSLSSPADLPVVAVTASDGKYLIELLKAGSATPLKMTSNLKSQVLPYSTPHRVSMSSSWGPGNELELKPDLASAGSMVYSSYPVKMGSYTSKSGTSSSSPYIAGAAALLIEQSNHNHKAADIRNRLRFTGSPAGSSIFDNLPVGSAAQQGGGEALIYNALAGMIRTNTSSFGLNDTVKGRFNDNSRNMYLYFTNTATQPITLQLGHRVVPSVSAYNSAGVFLPRPVHNNATNAAATLTFTRKALTIAPKETAKIVVVVTQPTGLSDSQFWVYSGFVTALSSELGLHGQPIRYAVPYLGLKGNYSEIPLLSPSSLGLLNPTTGQYQSSSTQ